VEVPRAAVWQLRLRLPARRKEAYRQFMMVDAE